MDFKDPWETLILVWISFSTAAPGDEAVEISIEDRRALLRKLFGNRNRG